MKKLLLLLGFLAGCGPDSNSYFTEEDIDIMYKEAQWGQSAQLVAPWRMNEERAIITLDRASNNYPISKTAMLAFEPPVLGSFGTHQNIFRWVLYIGAGGGNASFKIDAARLTQITMPAETVRLAIKCEQIDASVPFVSPTNSAKAAVFFANMPTATAPPTYTQYFAVAAGGTQIITPPPGAAGLLIDAAYDSDALAATTIYGLGASSITLNSWTGQEIADIVSRQEIIRVPGAAQSFAISNTGPNNIVGWVSWVLDF